MFFYQDYEYETDTINESTFFDPDAEQFVDASEQVLANQGAEQREDGTWVIPESEPFDDAFHVDRNGTTVTVVNALDADSLSEVAPAAVDNGRGRKRDDVVGRRDSLPIFGTEQSSLRCSR